MSKCLAGSCMQLEENATKVGWDCRWPCKIKVYSQAKPYNTAHHCLSRSACGINAGLIRFIIGHLYQLVPFPLLSGDNIKLFWVTHI